MVTGACVNVLGSGLFDIQRQQRWRGLTFYTVHKGQEGSDVAIVGIS